MNAECGAAHDQNERNTLTVPGKTVFIESGGMGVPLGAGRVNLCATMTLKSTAAKLVWVNTTPIVFKGEEDFSTREVRDTLYA